MTAATRLLEKKREMLELEQVLAARKEAFQMKMAALSARREELDKKELELRGSLIKFDQFLIENDVKKQRAKKKTSQERFEKERNTQEVSQRTIEKHRLKVLLEKQREKMSLEKVYRSYLEKVLEGTNEFNELKDILRKHETLSSNLEDLVERSTDMTDKLDITKKQFRGIVKKNDEKIMGYTNLIADLTWRKEQAETTLQKWESLWAHIQNTASRNVLLLGRVKMATENIYVQIYKQRGLQPKEVEGAKDQLKKIGTYINDLKDIITESRRAEEQAKKDMS